MNKNNFFVKLFYYCFPLVLLCQLMMALGLVSSNYPLTLLNVEYLIVGGMSILYINYNKDAKLLMLLFFLYSALSGVVYIFNDRPFSCYIDALRNYLMPMLMFFVGMNASFDKEKFLKYFGFTMALALIITLFGYVTFASWYVDYISSQMSAEDIETGQMNFLRFAGPYADAYYIQYLCVGLLAYYLHKVIIDNQTSIFNYLLIVLFIISLILCQQRTAMLFAFLSIPYFLFFKKKRAKYIFIFLALFIIPIILFLMADPDRIENVVGLLTDRAQKMTFSEAFGERRDKVFRVFSVWQNPILGDGVGVYGHAAHFAGFISVNDNAWIKLLVEQGFVGVIIFLFIVVNSLVKAFKKLNRYYPEVFIICFYLFAMVGSDSLSMVVEQSVFFWFALGRIWCKTN